MKEASEEVRKARYEVLIKNSQIPRLINKIRTFSLNSFQILNRRSGGVTVIAFCQDIADRASTMYNTSRTTKPLVQCHQISPKLTMSS